MADIQPIYGIPALKVNDIMVISDLHIGVESHLLKKGFNLTSKTKDMLNCILENSDDCDHLIVLGDVKDSVPGSSKQEYREIPDFFEQLRERFSNIDIVRGNHDTNIEDFIPSGIRIRPSSGMRIDDVGFIHGHTWPNEDVMRSDTLIMAHEHPAVMFKDGVGNGETLLADLPQSHAIPIEYPVTVNNHNAAGELDEFVDCIVNDRPIRTTAQEGAKTVIASLAAVKSSKTGMPVRPNYNI